MRVNKEESIRRSFVLTVEEIDRILKCFDDSDYFSFRAVCADKTVREFNSVTELGSFENSPNKEIEKLKINVYSKDHSRKASIQFFDYSYIDNIRIELEGEEKDVFSKSELIMEHLYGTSPWYAFISRMNRSGMILGFFISWIFTFALSSFILRRLLTPDYSSIIYWGIFIAAILACSVAFTSIWDRIVETYFPGGVFAIGQGVKRYKDKEIIRTTVIVGFGVSLLASILILLLSL